MEYLGSNYIIAFKEMRDYVLGMKMLIKCSLEKFLE